MHGQTKFFSVIIGAVAIVLFTTTAAYAQNYQFNATFGGGCTIGVPTQAELDKYPDIQPLAPTPDGKTVMSSNSLGNGTGEFRQFNQVQSDGQTFFINHGRFTFRADGVVIKGHYLGTTEAFNPKLIDQYGVLVGGMSGFFVVTDIVAAEHACTAPPDLSSVCSKGKWKGTVQLIPGETSTCLLTLEFKSDGAATR